MPEYFTQSCPTCGIRLRISDDHAHQRVECQHCQADFIAGDPHEPSLWRHVGQSALLDRADKLIALAEQRLVETPRERTSLTVVT